MVKIYSKRKVFSLKTINWADKSNLSQMKRSGQNILISLSCWQNDSGKFFFPVGQEIWWLLKYYTWSGQLREKSCLGMQRQFFSVDSIIRLSSFFVDSIVRRSLLFFCWFKHPTVSSFFFVCFVSNGNVVWTQIQLREKKKRNTHANAKSSLKCVE